MPTSRVPKNPQAAAEWQSKWEQRYSTNYVPRADDEKIFPRRRAPVKPTAPRTEPHSAPVIRAIERMINKGTLYSPEGPPAEATDGLSVVAGKEGT